MPTVNFLSITKTRDVRAGFEAKKWAFRRTSDLTSAIKPGAIVIIYDKERRVLTMPFEVRSVPNPTEVVNDVWEQAFYQPVDIEPMGSPDSFMAVERFVSRSEFVSTYLSDRSPRANWASALLPHQPASTVDLPDSDFSMLMEALSDTQPEPVLNNPSEDPELELVESIVHPDLDWRKINVYGNGQSFDLEIEACEAYVYFITSSKNSPGNIDKPVKIGKTNNVKRRLSTLSTGNGEELRVVVAVPNSKYSEAELHEMFSGARKRREWFYPVKSLRDFMSSEAEKINVIYDNYKVQEENRRREREAASKLREVL